MNSVSYKAFISYSHQDERWAKWLHRALESYRVPKKLVGTRGGAGKVPARIRPVFRDRDDLSSAADLSASVKKALIESENLIVVCSPVAAASHWVKAEIREFARLGKKAHIFCVIVDGEPSESGSVATLFPDAIAESGLQEPLAADARKWADGKQLAKLKLIGGMLGVPLDQLRRRDLQKRQKVWALTAVASIVVIAILLIAITARMAAQQRRDSGESLVAYKLNELRTLLNVTDDPENLSRLKNWDEQQLSNLITIAGSEKKEIMNAALGMRDQGIGYRENGDFTEALEKFQQSWALLAESYRRNRSDLEVFFELGQAEFYIGQVHMDEGKLDLAERAWMTYAEITRRLILMQPENAEWVLEMAYALTNLGVVQRAHEAFDPERTLQLMQSALEYNQIALVLEPNSEYFRSQLGQSHANFADAQLNVCDLDGALKSRQESVVLETGLLKDDSENPKRKLRLALALTGYAWVQASRGLNEEAIIGYGKAVELIEAISQENSDTGTIRRDDLVERKQLIVWLDAMSGRIDEAWTGSDVLADDWQHLLQHAGMEDVHTMTVYSTYLLDRAWLANERGDPGLAADLLEQGMAPLAKGLRTLPDNRDIGNALTLASFRYWKIKQELPPDEILSLLPDYRAYNGRTRACVDASMAFRKSIVLGEEARARQLAEYLLSKGYAETEFIQLCRKHLICPG